MRRKMPTKKKKNEKKKKKKKLKASGPVTQRRKQTRSPINDKEGECGKQVLLMS